jgi:hypothetical protein
MVVVLPGVDGAVTTTEMVWLIELDSPELGTRGGVTETTVQALFVLVAVNVK